MIRASARRGRCANAIRTDEDDKAKTADPRTIAALTAALKDTDKDVRETAMHALVQLRDPASSNRWSRRWRIVARTSASRRRSASASCAIARAVEPLTARSRIRTPTSANRPRSRSASSATAAQSTALTAALKDTDDDVREQAVFALGQLRDPARGRRAWPGALHDAQAPTCGEQAVFALGQIRDRRAVEPLISALKDANADVREQAAFALGQIRDRGAVEALVIALKDATPTCASRPRSRSARFAIRAPSTALTAALKDANADVRQQAAFALGQLAR